MLQEEINPKNLTKTTIKNNSFISNYAKQPSFQNLVT